MLSNHGTISVSLKYLSNAKICLPDISVPFSIELQDVFYTYAFHADGFYIAVPPHYLIDYYSNRHAYHFRIKLYVQKEMCNKPTP